MTARIDARTRSEQDLGLDIPARPARGEQLGWPQTWVATSSIPAFAIDEMAASVVSAATPAQ